jgi:transposase-like protein
MNPRDFKELRRSAKDLTPQQRHILAGELQEGLQTDNPVLEQIDRTFSEHPCCPHCHHEQVAKWGRVKGLQRYRCAACRRQFTPLTKTSLSRLRKREKWGAYLEAMEDGLSVRKAAQRIGVNRNTSFLWRHRFLAGPAEAKPTRLRGIVESDETFIRRSRKGERHLDRPARKRGSKAKNEGPSPQEWVPVLVARDRSAVTTDVMLPEVTAQTLKNALVPVLDKEAVLCHDGLPQYFTMARETGIAHRTVYAAHGKRVIKGIFHIQNVNAYHSRLKEKEWMERFHGVATRYLGNYLGWRRFLEMKRPSVGFSKAVIRSIVAPDRLHFLTGT